MPPSLRHAAVALLALAALLLPAFATAQPTSGRVLFEGEGVRAVARPSGTEPKLKVYLQVSLPPERSGDLDAARAEAAAVMEQLKADMAAALGL